MSRSSGLTRYAAANIGCGETLVATSGARLYARIYEMLSVSEIAMLLVNDALFVLPSSCSNVRERMQAARAMLNRRCDELLGTTPEDLAAVELERVPEELAA